MKQLIKIEARHLKPNDLIFDFKTRKVQKIDYVLLETESGDRYVNGFSKLANVHVCYGLESVVADNFMPDYEVLILIDTQKIETILPQDIRY